MRDRSGAGGEVLLEDERIQVAFEGARLLLGVARLGDGDLMRWWNSAALDPVIGGFILSNTFPRTGRVAGAELLLLSAARRHRQILSRQNAVHLYSELMPFHCWTRAWLAEQKTVGTEEVLAELESWHDVDTARERLREWTGPPTQGQRLAGAIELGRLEDSELDDVQLLLDRARRLAACYIDMEALTPAYFNLSPRRS